MLTHEQFLANLIHDLAQPLGTIETGAFCLERCIDPNHARAHEYLRVIQEQVEQATRMLAAARAELVRSRIQRESPVATFEMAGAASS